MRQIKRTIKPALFAAFCLCAAALLMPKLFTRALVNYANVTSSHALLLIVEPGVYPHWKVGESSLPLARSLEFLELAYRIAPSDPTVQWGLGRTALALGRADEAAAVLQAKNDPVLLANPLRFLDTLVAHAYSGDKASVMALYPASKVMSGVRSDVVALVYLMDAHNKIDAGDLEDAVPDLRQVITFRPFDLYANYYLWRYANQVGNLAEAAMRYKQLIYFPAEAVTAKSDSGLMEYVFEIFPHLLSDDLWGPDRSQNLMGYWVWQYPESPALRGLLESLALQFPKTVEWRFYLGELVQRLGQIDLAKQYYQQALSVDTDYVPAQDRLVQLGATLPLSSASVPLPETPQQNRELVAQMMGVPVAAVQLGSNLLQGDTFSTTKPGPPSGWLYSFAPGRLGWQFVAGEDALESNGSARIVNLWWPAEDSISGYIPYAEYIGDPVVVPTPWLMVSLWYKQQGKPRDIGLVVIGTEGTWKPFFTETYLFNTAEGWSRLVVVGPTPRVPSNLFPDIRNEGASNVWFHDIALYPIEVSVKPTQCSHAPCEHLFATK